MNIILINKYKYIIIFNLRFNRTPKLNKKKYYAIPTKIRNNEINPVNIIKRESELLG